MKKWIWLIPVAVIAAVVAGIALTGRGDVRDVQRIPVECTLYSENDIETAMDIVEKTFWERYDGCKLLTIAYDEEESLREIERQREHGEFRFLILVTDFYVGSNAEPGFERNVTYHDWKWIFLDQGNGWELISWGYA